MDTLDTQAVSKEQFFLMLHPSDLLANRKLGPKEETELFEREPALKRKAILMGARELLVYYRDELNTKRFRATYHNAVMETELHRALARTAMRLLAAWDQVMLEEFVGQEQTLEAVAS